MYLVAENNFGKTTGTKRLNFTTRFDNGEQQHGAGGHDNGMMKSSSAANAGGHGAELLRNMRGLPR